MRGGGILADHFNKFQAGGGVQQCKREQALAHAPPTRSEKLRAIHRALASLHMWLMGKTRQIIVGRPTLHSDLHGLLLSK